MGRPLSEENKRFLVVPRCVDGSVYVAELANGMVKVGQSLNPRTRMESLAYYVRKCMQSSITRFHVVCDVGSRRCFKIEKEALRKVRGVATIAHGTEFFSNVSFEAAAQIVDQVARQFTRSSSLASVSTLKGREFPGAVSDQVAGAGSFIRGVCSMHAPIFFHPCDND